MQSFLNRLAKVAIQDHANQLGDLIIVLPSRRAILFLQEEFKKELQNSSWLPKIISLEDFIHDMHTYTQIDDIDLLFELYTIHQNVEGSNAESLHDFMGWATTLLHDFNEIDINLVDGQELFQFLTEAKAIENWNLDQEQLSEFQQQYLRFWKKLGDYYELLKNKLLSDSKVYQGLAFRLVAENIDHYAQQLNEHEQLLFAGFNALTKAEAIIVDFLQKEKNATIYWDSDEYYMNDHFQEAGRFLRNHKKQAKKGFNWEFDDLLNGEKKVHIHGISGNVGQAKLIGNLLKDDDFKNAAVVLSNEEILTAVLESLPPEVESINVTMGYPLSLSFVYSWIEQYFLLFRKNDNDLSAFYAKDIRKVLDHSVLKLLDTSENSSVGQMMNQFRKEKLIYIPNSRLAAIDDIIGIPLFAHTDKSPLNLIKNVQEVLLKINIAAIDRIDVLNNECVQAFTLLFKRLERLFSKESNSYELESLLLLFRQLVAQQTVAFVGEPLSGLQIMGILESRSLDFENIIISNVNEGTLPAGKKQNSFIPFDIKHKFGLPLHTDKDAIFAYHFYRLLQRAKNIAILYNTKVDQLDGGEKSRFIEQLIHEIPIKNPKADLRHSLVSVKSKHSAIKAIRIPMSEEISQKVGTQLKRGISPSAINTFLNCPLDYYYKYVALLKEEETLSEKVEDNTIGTLIHNCLENLYQPYLNRILDKTSLHEIKKKIDNELYRQYKEVLNLRPESGNHKLSFEVSKRFVNALVSYDELEVSKGNELIIFETEKEIAAEVQLEIENYGPVDVRLYGKIDRIDSLNDEIRVIDYKTGATKASELGYSSVNVLLNGNKAKAVQLLIYQYMYQEQMNQSVTAGIISLRNISNALIALKSKDIAGDTLELLNETVRQMLTIDEFVHNSNSNYCHFC